MNEYEYRRVYVNKYARHPSNPDSDWEEYELTRMGLDGWQLATIVNGAGSNMLYFMRKITTSRTHEA